MSLPSFEFKTDFKVYSGEELLNAEFPPREFIINNFLREKDSLIIAAPPKTGKSVYVLQKVFSLTSGDPFLDQFDINRVCKVFYVQLEGTVDDTQDRVKRMMRTVPFNPQNFALFFSSPIALEEISSCKMLMDQINATFKPDVIVIDPVYFAMRSSLSDDEAVRGFVGNLRVMQDFYKCVIILVHHTHKGRFELKKGKVIKFDEGDDAVFGSVFFQAWATHQILLQRNPDTKIVQVGCKLQRAGDIVPNLELILRQPDPLYFEQVNSFPSQEKKIQEFLPSEFRTAREIYSLADIPKPTFYRDIKVLIEKNQVEVETVSKDGTMMRLYRKK